VSLITRRAPAVRLASLIALAIAQLSCSRTAPPPADTRSAVPLRVGISFAASQSSKPLDGRVLLFLSTDSIHEPRAEISDAVTSQQVFGVDANGLAPGVEAVVSDTVLGYPAR
jgi:hypothetical protein